ncbi:dihydrofolate reductase family protein [Salimicrobium flavidum]|uniref:dihydrofolate reductase family protein n=1 Tax=Salimicrobium flavidum TaxID=570947 RepID=UPI001F2026C7|nr:dihydrofolate reductase family protein [Salimicrobium flavidum]
MTLFIVMSLDGFITGRDESLAWLDAIEGEGDNGFSEFYETVDTVVMGRKTYDWLQRQELERWPYEEKETYVITSSFPRKTETVTFTSADVMEELKEEEGKTIWVVGGGRLLRTYLERGDITDIVITIAPVLLGEGVPLFSSVPETTLERKRVRQFGQFTELHFEIKSGERGI